VRPNSVAIANNKNICYFASNAQTICLSFNHEKACPPRSFFTSFNNAISLGVTSIESEKK